MTSRGPIVAMSFRPSIPWRVALQQSPPPLAQPGSCCAEHFRLSSKTQRTATWDFARVSRKGFTPGGWAFGRMSQPRPSGVHPDETVVKKSSRIGSLIAENGSGRNAGSAIGQTDRTAVASSLRSGRPTQAVAVTWRGCVGQIRYPTLGPNCRTCCEVGILPIER